MEYPIAEEFNDAIQGKQVSVSYWISNSEKSKEELQKNHLKKIVGAVDADYDDVYSAITGYLWTNEELKIGGHDFMDELRSNIGKFIYLEINVHK